MAESVLEDQILTADPAETWQPWLNRIAAARRRNDDLVQERQENVNRRRVRSGETITPSTSTVAVPKDWSLTKAKIAQLYSQTPEVRLTAKYPNFEQAVQPFGRELNQTITSCNLGATIEEELADVINAAGIAAVMITCDKRTVTVNMPMMDPMAAAQAGILDVPMMPVTKVADIQYLVERISPADLLIPTDFTGSDYNKAKWLGRDGRMTWAQAVAQLGVTEAEKDAVLGQDIRAKGRQQTLSADTHKFRDTDVVNFTELFYWRHVYHDDETLFKALHHLVFVNGLEAPKIDEPYKAQVRIGQPGQERLVGVLRNPIQVLTLTYISDDSLPPSDSSIGRFQVAELEASRTAMRDQRKHSIPIRWGNTALLSKNQRDKIDEGTHQGFIWINGPGDRAVGEVARASFPQERFEFDAVASNDLTEIYQTGTNQAGAFAKGERSAREASIIEQNFQRRVGIEQDKTQKHFLGVVEVIAGHLAIFGTFELPDQLGPMRQELANAFTYDVRVDSTVRLNAQQRIEQLDAFVNKWAQSGYLNPKPIAQEWASLIDLDPALVIVDPQPKAPEPVGITISSALDMRDPAMFAALMRTGQAPTPEDVAAAIKAVDAINAMMPPIVESTGEQAQTGGPPAEVESPGIANPNWQEMPRINKRDEDGGM